MDIKMFFRKAPGFSPEMIDMLDRSGFFNNITNVDIKKKTIFIHEGDLLDCFYFLLSGVVRWLYINEDGNELTDKFFYKYGESVVPSSCYYNLPSQISIQAITDVRLLKVPKVNFEYMMKKYPELLNVSTKLLTDRFLQHWYYWARILPKNTLSRYQWFVETHGSLIGKINKKYIASYLMMTPSTLSRVQKQYQKQLLQE